MPVDSGGVGPTRINQVSPGSGSFATTRFLRNRWLDATHGALAVDELLVLGCARIPATIKTALRQVALLLFRCNPQQVVLPEFRRACYRSIVFDLVFVKRRRYSSSGFRYVDACHAHGLCSRRWSPRGNRKGGSKSHDAETARPRAGDPSLVLACTNTKFFKIYSQTGPSTVVPATQSPFAAPQMPYAFAARQKLLPSSAQLK